MLALINTFRSLNSQMIKLAQDHSANQGYTCTLGSRHEDYLLVFFPFVLLDTMLGTLSISNPFHLLNSYWSFKTQLKAHLLHESSWVFSALFPTWVRCIWRRLHPSLFPLTHPFPLPGSRCLQSREDLGLALGSQSSPVHGTRHRHRNACSKLSSDLTSLVWSKAW